MAAGMAAMLWVAACSAPEQVGLFGWDNDYGDTTGAIATALSGTPSLVSSADLAAAGAAAVTLFEKKECRTSAPWENSLTGARGTITPVAAAYRDGGAECRDFLASYVREAKEAWFQGEACRNLFGRFAVRDIKPWRRP
jgi:surface antigen